MNIVFMGTPEFAVFQLKALIKRGHRICGVFCQPDKPQGRHMVVTEPPVKIVARENNIPVYQLQSLKNPMAHSIIKELNPDLIVVAAYGKLLPKNILDYPPQGAINVHGSLLPRLRGAAPIQRAIIDGERETGVTIMQMGEGMDTGDILLQKAIEIGENENTEELFTRLAVLGSTALVEAVDSLSVLIPQKQKESLATWAAPLKPTDGEIKFSDSAINNYRRF
ncbi:MAG: methionyl-tRNA formyltransferase, partial [Oscillospiraceae bacterium]